DGVVITFVDITDQKKMQFELSEARDFADAIVETAREPLVVLDADLRVLRANKAFYKTFGVSPGGTEKRPIYELGNRQWDIPALRDLLEKVLPGNTVVHDFPVDHEFPGIGRRTMLLNARTIVQQGALTRTILLAIEDVTERKPIIP
ncbi:MAG: PAS domain-containing protein, partial [Betaproteobacteria bacterium]